MMMCGLQESTFLKNKENVQNRLIATYKPYFVEKYAICFIENLRWLLVKKYIFSKKLF